MTTSQQPEVTGVPLSETLLRLAEQGLGIAVVPTEPYRVCRRLFYLS